MKANRRTIVVTAGALGAALLLDGTASAAPKTVTIGYQTVVDPSKVPQADGAYEKAKAPIDWRKFDSGADVIAAVASGGRYRLCRFEPAGGGGQPRAADPDHLRRRPDRAGRGAGRAQRRRHREVADLAGKKVAVPFVSTTHYSLLAALKHWNVDPKVRRSSICGRRKSPPPSRAATSTRLRLGAGARPDQDDGKVVLDSAGRRLGRADLRRLDRAHRLRREEPGSGARLRQGDGCAYSLCRQAGGLVGVVAAGQGGSRKLTGAKLEEVPELLKRYVFPTLAEEARRICLAAARSRRSPTRPRFLKEQGKVEAVLARLRALRERRTSPSAPWKSRPSN